MLECSAKEFGKRRKHSLVSRRVHNKCETIYNMDEEDISTYVRHCIGDKAIRPALANHVRQQRRRPNSDNLLSVLMPTCHFETAVPPKRVEEVWRSPSCWRAVAPGGSDLKEAAILTRPSGLRR